MNLRLMLLAVILGVLLTNASAGIAEEQFDNIASDQEAGYLYRAAMGPGWNGAPSHPPYWAPGGDRFRGMRVGSPYYWSATGYPEPVGLGGPAPMGFGPPGFAGGFAYGNTGYNYGYGYGYGMGMGPMGDPYGYHFGPGFHRHSNYGHFRFPYYSYRAPWYSPGPPVYNRDTNFPW